MVWEARRPRDVRGRSWSARLESLRLDFAWRRRKRRLVAMMLAPALT
jgi:hypothetical protein